jgi:hypothetical protein
MRPEAQIKVTGSAERPSKPSGEFHAFVQQRLVDNNKVLRRFCEGALPSSNVFDAES